MLQRRAAVKRCAKHLVMMVKAIVQVTHEKHLKKNACILHDFNFLFGHRFSIVFLNKNLYPFEGFLVFNSFTGQAPPSLTRLEDMLLIHCESGFL